MSRQTKPTGSSAIRVGDPVRFRMVLHDVEATVIEDRGAIGVGGRRLFRVLPLSSSGEPSDLSEAFELPAEDLQRLG